MDLHTTLKNDGIAEELDHMMDGQSHRARLREMIDNSGGQQYDIEAVGNASRQPFATHSARGGASTKGDRSGGFVGTRGRMAPASPRRLAMTQGFLCLTER